MSKIDAHCITCDRPIVKGDFCPECRNDYAAYLEADPPPQWLMAAREMEYQRRNSERTEQRHSIEIGEALDAIAGQLEIVHKPGTHDHFMSAFDEVAGALVTLENEGIMSRRETLVVLNDLAMDYTPHHHQTDLKPTDNRKVENFNRTCAKDGIEPIKNSREFRHIRHYARLKLAAYRKRELSGNC